MKKCIKSTIVFVILVSGCSTVEHVNEQQERLDLEKMCETLEDLNIWDTYITSASIVPANNDLPEHCLVRGYVLPAIHFEIRLPIKNWNGKFLMEGCGGFCGSLKFPRGAQLGLERNYAVSYTDSGHWGGLARWAYNNRGAEIDWAYRAIHETAIRTKLVIAVFYDRWPEKSYFRGSSTGGRMALMEAWRYPDDFDGIISEAPVMDNTGLYIDYHWLVRKNIGADGKKIVSSNDLKPIIDAVYQVCDGTDGLEDGLISEPGRCTFDPNSLLCGENHNEGCLTAEQVATLKAWYGGPKNSAGEQLYPGGLPLGSEPFWPRWITGKTRDIDDSLVCKLSLEFFRYMAFQDDPGENFGISDFDFDTDPPRMEYMASIINSDNPHLEAFRAREGKLLMIHGWADPICTPWKSIEYYKEVEQRFVGREATQEFFRLFMIPGMDHGGNGRELGITKDSIDPLTALEKWIEEGQAPDSLLVNKFAPDGSVLWTRPVYPYPLRTVYKGEGDVNSASSYERKEP
jgi:pimeloyl-ACP methyl ester carboxylesterase